MNANLNSGWRLTQNPSDADLIIFMEHHPEIDPLFLRVFFHPWRRRWSEKCWMYHDADYVYPIMKGVYPGLERPLFQSGVVESWFYIAQHVENKNLEMAPLFGGEHFLYSFTGSERTHPIRSRILSLKDDRAWLQDTSLKNSQELNLTMAGLLSTRSPAVTAELIEYHQRFAKIVQDSKFVLCPRGCSPTSYRLLETMRAGRTPVIISDDWAYPSNLPWNEFAILVPEAQVEQIPQLLRERESEAVMRGQTARQVWEAWCADDTKYGRLLEKFALMAEAPNQAGIFGIHIWIRLLASRPGLRALWHSLRSLNIC